MKKLIRAVFWASGISAFCISCCGIFVTKHLTAGSQQAERRGNDLQNATERLVLHLSHICGTNRIILSVWPNHLTCTPVILWQWHWIWTRGCKAEKTQLIQARETQNTEEIHQIYTKQGEESHWALLLVSYPMHSALTLVLSVFRYLKGMTELPNRFLFRPLPDEKGVQCFSACHCLFF